MYNDTKTQTFVEWSEVVSEVFSHQILPTLLIFERLTDHNSFMAHDEYIDSSLLSVLESDAN